MAYTYLSLPLPLSRSAEISNKLSLAEAQNGALTETAQSAQGAKETLTTALERAEARLAKMEEARSVLDDERQSMRKVLDETNAKCAELNGALTQVEGKYETLNAGNKDLKEAYEDVKARLAALQNETKVQSERLVAAETKRDQLSEAVLISNRETEKLNKDRTDLQKRVNGLRQDLQGYRREEDAFRRKQASLKKEQAGYDLLRNTNNELKDEIEELQQKIMARDHEIRSLRSGNEGAAAKGAMQREEEARKMQRRIRDQEREIKEYKAVGFAGWGERKRDTVLTHSAHVRKPTGHHRDEERHGRHRRNEADAKEYNQAARGEEQDNQSDEVHAGRSRQDRGRVKDAITKLQEEGCGEVKTFSRVEIVLYRPPFRPCFRQPSPRCKSLHSRDMIGAVLGVIPRLGGG